MIAKIGTLAEGVHVDAGAGAHVAERGKLHRFGAREILRRW